MMFSWKLLMVIVAASATQTDAHGRLRDPVARSSMWRLKKPTPVNYNDNAMFCGGFDRQWSRNGGKCGICGDPWDEPTPRSHELGGRLSTDLIARTYKRGQVIQTWVELTANHLGWFELRLCPNANPKTRQDATQECLDRHVLQKADGTGTRVTVTKMQWDFHVAFKLPDDITCDFCVLQWHYNAGNGWGNCGNGRSAIGCGPQESFRGCSNIRII